MRKNSLLLFVACLAVAVLGSGCVERKLSIITEPAGALVVLNDEEIGTSPVTVEFQWYGDYDIRISKEGYQTLKTHKMLKGPWYDRFPFDFFAQVLNPNRIVDYYEWEFDLEVKKETDRDALIESAKKLKEQL